MTAKKRQIFNLSLDSIFEYERYKLENKIVEIRVNELFGFLNHRVDLKEEGVTFIHGPNGCGKTTFLKLIACFFEWDIGSLNEINFGSLDIVYNKEISVEKSIEVEVFDDEQIEVPLLKFLLKEDGKIIKEFEYQRDIKDIKIHASEIDDCILIKGVRVIDVSS